MLTAVAVLMFHVKYARCSSLDVSEYKQFHACLGKDQQAISFRWWLWYWSFVFKIISFLRISRNEWIVHLVIHLFKNVTGFKTHKKKLNRKSILSYILFSNWYFTNNRKQLKQYEIQLILGSEFKKNFSRIESLRTKSNWHM